jgi:selenocysteine lyase/cysteine desulfurase
MMRLSRRGLIRGAAVSAVLAAAPRILQGAEGDGSSGAVRLPATEQFAVRNHEVCLNNARWHPMSDGAMKAVQEHLAYKSRGIWTPPDAASEQQRLVKESFARLIHATPEEVAYVNSTTAGENLIVAFRVNDTAALSSKLKRRRVDVSLSPGRMRISPSVYNTQGDVDQLLEALS